MAANKRVVVADKIQLVKSGVVITVSRVTNSAIYGRDENGKLHGTVNLPQYYRFVVNN